MQSNKITLGKTNLATLSGDEDITAWSEEELIRGQRRDRNGRWSGRPPKVVPKAVHDELVRRKLSEAHDLLRDNLVGATKVLVEIAADETTEATVRLKAVGMIMDRVLGRPAERIDLTAHSDPPWMEAIGHALLVATEADVIDAEVVDAESKSN